MRKTIIRLLTGTLLFGGIIGCNPPQPGEEKDPAKNPEIFRNISIYVAENGEPGYAMLLRNKADEIAEQNLKEKLAEEIRRQEAQQTVQENKHQQIPENVVYRNGKVVPAQGYVWLNSQNQADLRVRELEQRCYTYNSYDDRNGNGTLEVEEINQKDLFKIGDEIEVYFRYETYSQIENANFTFRVFNPDQREVFSEEIITPYKHQYVMTWGFETNKNSKPGKYSLEWYVDNQLIYDHEIRIIK